jgi:hypothetical protein
MKKIISPICAILLTINLFSQQRGRPYQANGTVVSDDSTLLRGCFISTDYYHFDTTNIKDGTKEGIYKARDEYGMNAFHFYCGWYATPTGRYQPLADSLVKWTREAGVYLVITIGGWDKNGHFDSLKVMNFWDYYAPRYADETHVIYEIQNEAQFVCNSPSHDSTINMEIEAYNIIRSAAPETHVMLMSYSGIPDLQYLEADINSLETGGVDFSNASIAYHGYYWCLHARKHTNPSYASATELNVIPQLQDQGYSFVITEFERDSTLAGSLEYSGKLIEFYENDMEMSWLCFYAFPENYPGHKAHLFNANTDFKGKVDAMGVSWCPDHGIWPEDASSCNATDIDKLLVNKESTIYPNPLENGKVYLNIPKNQEIIDIKIYDVFGNLISIKHITNDLKYKNNIELLSRASIKEGVYIIEINYQNKRHKNYRLIVH